MFLNCNGKSKITDVVYPADNVNSPLGLLECHNALSLKFLRSISFSNIFDSHIEFPRIGEPILLLPFNISTLSIKCGAFGKVPPVPDVFVKLKNNVNLSIKKPQLDFLITKSTS